MLLFLLALISTAIAGDITLPAYPLALKTPYLATYLRYNQSINVPEGTASFWRGQPLTWLVLARVNQEAVCLFGCSGAGLPMAQQTGISFTSTHTYVNLSAESTDFVLDFFSPVSLTNYTRQSLPYSYLRVEATAQVDILTAIDDTWTSLQPETQANAFSTDAGSRGFMLSGSQQSTWTEKNDMAAWGNIVLAASGQGVTQQIGAPDDVVSQFHQCGKLSGSTYGYQSGNLVAVASWGSSATFAVGVEQEQVIDYLGVPQTGYYQSQVCAGPDAVDFFFADEDAARSESDALDQQVKDMGSKISTNYSDILESAVRQTWAGSQVVIPLDSKDPSQATAWAKEISTDGNVQTLADLLPKIFPAFYALAPDYMRLHLNPVMDYISQWPADFAFHDLGKHYPNATGETVEKQEPLIVDQTAVIQWMAYAYQRASGDTEWVKPYLAGLQKYADYLVQHGLFTESQSSSQDNIGPTPNQTGLAMYSAIALTSFGALSGLDNYTNVGHGFVPTILDLGLDPNKTHFKAHFNDTPDSWITTYMFAFDALLDLETFDQATYKLASDWYASQMTPYGVPFYSGVNFTSGDFQAWAAATSSPDVRDDLLNGIHAFLDCKINSEPGPTQWVVRGDNVGQGGFSIAKGNVGSYFMPAAVMQDQQRARGDGEAQSYFEVSL